MGNGILQNHSGKGMGNGQNENGRTYAIVNDPGGAAKVDLLPFVHECGLAGSVLDLIDGGSLYAQSQRHLIRILYFSSYSTCIPRLYYVTL